MRFSPLPAYPRCMNIFGTVRSPDGAVETVEVEREAYDEEAYRAVVSQVPEGWVLLHVRVDR